LVGRSGVQGRSPGTAGQDSLDAKAIPLYPESQ
jgi:hypothetical protein